MRFIALGTTEFVKHCINGFIDSGQHVHLLVSLPKELQPDNSIDLSEFATEKGLDYLEVEDINSPENIAALKAYTPDIIFSAWPRILKQSIFSVPRSCIIGSHPTALPFNRGRHPLHWEIVLGFSKSRLSFFRMDEGIDTGHILLQMPYEIRPEDTIADLVVRVNSVAYNGSYQLSQILATADVPEGIEQDHGKTNYWRKRTLHDVIIDFRMSAEHIVRTVHSFTLPYPCAMLLFEKSIIKIIDANLMPTDMPLEQLQRIEPGRIISVDNQSIQIKTADAIVKLECLNQIPEELQIAKYIHPPSKYISKHNINLD